MNVPMTSAEFLEQVESNHAGRGGEECSTGTNGTDHDNDHDNDNDSNNNNNKGNNNNNKNRINNDCADEDDNAAFLKFDPDRRYCLRRLNPNFPVEAIDGYMRAMYRDFIAQFGSVRNDLFYDDRAYKYFNIHWGLDNCFSPLHRLDLLTEAIESRGEHLSGVTLDVATDEIHDSVRLMETQDIQKFARFCACGPNVTVWCLEEYRQSFQEAKYFFQEAAAAGNQCRLATLRLSCDKMNTWSDSFVSFLQSSRFLTELRLELVARTDRASIRAVFLQGMARNTSLKHLLLEAAENWVVQPLGTMLMLRRQNQGCRLPRLIFQSSQCYNLTLTPQTALLLIRGVCLGSVEDLRLKDITTNRHSVIQLVETLQESAIHPHFALKNLSMEDIRVYSNDRYRGFCGAIGCLLNGVPGLEAVSIIGCDNVPFAYCAGPSSLLKLTFIFGINNDLYANSAIDFELFLEHLPSSSIRILNLDSDEDHMKCIQRNPRSLYKLEQVGLSRCSCDFRLWAMFFMVFVSSTRLMRISGIYEGTDREKVPQQNEFNQLCLRNRCIQAFHSGFVEETPLQFAKNISCSGLWPAALAVLCRVELKLTTTLCRIEQQMNNDDFSLSNVDIPVVNVTGSVIYSFLRQHACRLHATCERGKRQMLTSIDATESKNRN